MSRTANILLGSAFVVVSGFVIYVTFARTGSPMYAAKVERDSLRVDAVKRAVSAIHKHCYSKDLKTRIADVPEKLFPGVMTELQYKSWIDPQTREHFGYRRTSPTTYEITATFELASRDLENRSISLEHKQLEHSPGPHTMKFKLEDRFLTYMYWNN